MSARPQSRIGLLPKLLALGFALGISIVAAEVILTVLRKASTGDEYHVWAPGSSQTFSPNPEIVPGISGDSQVTFNSEGMRGKEPPSAESDAFRILTVGGSTTECLYLDQEETWAHLLETGLNAKAGKPVHVGNIGKSGINTREHVLQLDALLPQHPEIDLIVTLIGVNDMMLPVCEVDTYAGGALDDPERREAILLRGFSVVPGAITKELNQSKPFHSRLATFDLLRRLKWAITSEPQDPSGGWMKELRATRQRATLVDELPDITAGLSEYRGNIERMIDIATQHGKGIIFLTQPYLWDEAMPPEQMELLWFGGVGDFLREECSEYYTPRALAEAMENYNATLLAICAERGVPCLDLAEAIGRDVASFYDDVHFTEQGARRVAEETTQFITLP